MKRAPWPLGPVVILLAIAGCGPGEDGSSGGAEVESAFHSWDGYHWALTSNPFTLKLGSNVSATWSDHLDVASFDWSQSGVLDTTRVAGQSTRNCRPTAGRVEVCNARYGFNGWLGIAAIWVSGGVHITQGTVRVNDSYFGRSPYNTPAWRQTVMCQEIGHTLGLDHQDENFDNANLGSCMDYTSNPIGNEHPNAHDYGELAAIYDHLDGTTTVDGSAAGAGSNLPPRANENADDAGPPAWGRLVRRSSDGRLEVWELDLGAGQKVIRFVRRP